MNIILFDDDKWLRDKCKELVRKSGHSIHLSTDSVIEVEHYLKKHNEPALFFVDIMIDLNNYAGLTLVDAIKSKNQNHVVVFMTAYPELILYNTHSKTKAINIILKSKEHFESEFTEMLEIAEVLFQGNAYFHYTTKCNAFGIIPLADILYLEKVKGRNSISIHHKKGMTIIRGTFKEITEKLDSCFLRCHNSVIVNTQNIVYADFKTRQILFNARQACPFSRAHKKELEKCLLSCL